MSLRCRPGDQAIIICGEPLECIGREVAVLQRAYGVQMPDGQMIYLTDPSWLVRFNAPAPCLQDCLGQMGHTLDAVWPDAYLLPIRPPDEEDERDEPLILDEVV